ncbi:exopolysaccharide biosynthesis polyprenyl glycosylphosphotransferase [Roseimicrobium gellanilyticum]|uniref:Exopolysaccharide biosynthesis polyprenyl glycosylphosphotransferase n=1 Tax=Roseimicrobium gellanilyticum TaxID=748857 RepID=A0A366HXC2_9BACT|nr:exopolysaccharide biosynthesis polyprenyl glycosylphosphotransferase [Roseimicrobium gellanilyticum]RBP48135.1 exopolysaccharide biosynthesis polyprenyl glycosylphosphotransferase [Roseimicrobium gellanilyticum]
MIHSVKGKERWNATRNHFILDAAIVFAGMVAASAVRFQDFTPPVVLRYLPILLIASIAVPAILYGAGLYSVRAVHLKKRHRYFLLGLCYLAGVVVMLTFGSLDFSSRVGRGVLAISFPITFALLMAHHAFLARLTLGYRERVAVLVTGKQDYESWQQLQLLRGSAAQLIGIIDVRSPQERRDHPLESNLLGARDDLMTVVEDNNIDTVLCSGRHLKDAHLVSKLREVCFGGVRLCRIVDFFEENYHTVPVWLIDLDWLLSASSLPHRGYVRKWKRLFDIAASAIVGLFLFPFLLVAMAWVRIVSPEGPVFFRQIRCGRLGRKFEVLKLRTMRVDAESDGPKWASKNDPRVFLGGGFLRKFRIDEIPQLWNILRGDMSFVGPRPERPDFIEQLSTEIPYFRERLLVAPGLTGWAQVNYPYGATTQDARRKLEYDLYYMKHMTLTLDMFVLLDTVRIVLTGGVSQRALDDAASREAFVSRPEADNEEAQEQLAPSVV